VDYLDFAVEISGTENNFRIRAESPFMAPTESAFELPYDERDLDAVLDRVELAVLKGSGRRRTLQTAHRDVVREFGSTLFGSLISGDVEEAYYDAYRRASERQLGLRIRLTTEPAQLASLPWELLYDPRQRDFVCLSSSTPLVRHLRTANPALPLSVTAPLRILGMVTSPADLHPLDVAGEKERIRATLEPLVSQDLVEIGWVEGGTWRDLQEAMFEGPWHVFHFIGHGAYDQNRRESILAFENEAGGPYRAVSPAELGRLIERDHALRLVVLNACEGARGDEQNALSSTAAHLVYRSVPAVLAMQWEISDDAAIEFARTFYRSIGEGSSVDGAVADSRLAISMAVVDSLELATPVLYMRTPDGKIFDVSAAAGTEPAISVSDDAAAETADPTDGTRGADEEAAVLAPAYLAAKAMADAGEWKAALAALDELSAEHGGGAAVAALRATIREQYRRQQLADRSARSEELYIEAVGQADQERWSEALKSLDQLAAVAPGYPGATELRARAEASLKAAEPAPAPPPTPPIASKPPMQETPPPPDRSPVTPPRTPIGSSLLWMLLFTFLGNGIAALVATVRYQMYDYGEIYYDDVFYETAQPTLVLTLIWAVVYLIAALRKGQRIAPDRGSALRAAPYAPYKAGGIRTLAGLPVNAFVTLSPVILFPGTEVSSFAWIGIGVLMLFVYWSAIRHIERRVSNNS